ncbi:peptidoglycan DD-metalloendopeptidase family protein [Clostridium chauvoei]|uniref:Peptidoglycan DD-metalloendopeptidase family protein n=2 Tax=Clostridium chauvoei TaxID=46867 RepID=A0ABD4RKB6_9CLOT|nr:M23 family metallopeptidase [Clostridium chauvoei]ATD56109.1 hypothetical protein BTM20_13240 [Clostridium chauvoei]ATD58599.1 hypothetical protein BTM21_13265 [Clostridium chauvoei]MBX7281733.1 peptidoglycan DD-metalloendopeptidase family protein [Clostridium chauvoei]MBX7284254.1 peptidoglycan DD-metalloendopeptidase family protein [Clostridium chauvoei]MBX7286140.1 peptidoglycan DD-metalloendopeptidase family protein [Clostridium chauvoei]
MYTKKDTVGVTIKIILLIIPIVIMLLANDNYILEAYLNDSVIGYVNSKEETKQVYNELLQEVNIDSNIVNNNNEPIKYNKVNEEVVLSNKNEIKKNMLGALTGKTSAYRLNLDGEKIGYIASNDMVNNILKLAADKQIDNLNIDKGDIVSADISCNINLQEEVTDLSSLDTEEELAEEIYNISKEGENLVAINIKTKETVQESIKPQTITASDENLYIGESRIEEGQDGIKNVLKEITYKNVGEEESKVLKEDIVKEPINTIIYKGSKNPYYEGVAFLNKPTGSDVITSGYGERWNSFHKGIDIAGNMGDEVKASIEGTIIYAEYNNGGYGNLIKVEHEGGMTTYYAHLSKIYVKPGDKVKAGDLIGAIGSTGFSTGPHLHFELRVNGEPVNPYGYIL